MKPFIRGLGSALVVVTVGAVLSPAGVVLGKPALVGPITPPPKTSLPKINAANLKPTPPKLHLAGPCGPGQSQCFLGGGKVPATVAAGSPDAARPKACYFAGDPKMNCGKCEPCPLYKTEGAFCGPKGCDYKSCLPNFADLDGNRANGCETWVPIKKAVPPRPAPANMPAKACATDRDCGPPDIRCVEHRAHTGAVTRSCEWMRCRTAADCSYLASTGDGRDGIPTCGSDGPNDSHGCGYSYPTSCGRFNVPSGDGLCRPDMSVLDVDGDGALSAAMTVDPAGVPVGTDCDDGDPSRFPGNTEVCDTFAHDEDCDPRTNGAPDNDHDGQPDGACCNVLANGAKNCGTDCDDTNPGMNLAAKRCSPDMQVCTVDRSGGGQVPSWVNRPCGADALCVPQGDGTGICQHR